MTKLLIVDDEQIERDGLQMILQKTFPELFIRQAKNGRVAVEFVEEFCPDIVLMDINMPGMNGLEAVEKINESHPEIKFVMVTAYDTFDYARQALKLGVKDYLLKPSKVNEITATVGKVLAEKMEEQKLIELSKQQQESLQKTLSLVETDVVTQLLFDHVHEVHADRLIEMLDIHSTGEQFVMNILLPPRSEAAYSAVKEVITRTKSGWIGALYGRQLPVIVFRDPQRSYRAQAISLAKEILSTVKQDQQQEWFIGIGTICGSLNQIRQSYQESLIAIMDPSLPVKYRFYADVPVRNGARSGLGTKQEKKKFFDHVRLGQWDQVQESAMNLIHSYEREGADFLQIQQRMLELLWLVSRVMSEVGIETDTPLFSFQAQDGRQLRAETELLLRQMKESYVKHYGQIEADTIHQIKRYISEHSHEDISLEALSDKMKLNPIYISKMFKEKLGVNYIDFLTECRIEKAKVLLRDPEKSIKEITYEVGYHEPNYFSKVFKKVAAVSPKEYRKMLMGMKS